SNLRSAPPRRASAWQALNSQRRFALRVLRVPRGMAAVAACVLGLALVRAQAGGAPLDAAAVQELMAQFHVPGVSIAVVRAFKVEWAKGYGTADVETGAPVTTETMFQAASISKTIAAMASVKAAQDGRFSLDQDVTTILKSWPLAAGDITE